MSARILVVDDEANIRALIDEILSEEGYEVTTAADAKEARSARKRQDFDLVLLDIWMPDTDGISLLREWSEGGSTGTVVMMSGHGTVDTAVEATRLGAVDFVEKPVSLAKLLRTVERALAVRRTKGERRGAAMPSSVPAGKSQPVRALREQLARVAQHSAHTLFTGEPGSGRELFARFLAS
ncbi:MAG TPA: response regulator, partial [Gammaproteobacteria bacterium]|nr:response regulator [Gammaproteobacteria bacterium]